MNRRNFSKILAASIILGVTADLAHGGEPGSNLIDLIMSRHSLRQFQDTPVTDAEVETMLRCAMQAPSAMNEQPWEFVVIRDKAILAKIAEGNKAKWVETAPLAIVVCMNRDKEKSKSGIGILDMGMCAENLMLAATAMGIGSVFTGIYPSEERTARFRELLNLPENIVPIGAIVLGRPVSAHHEQQIRYNPDVIHTNTW